MNSTTYVFCTKRVQISNRGEGSRMRFAIGIECFLRAQSRGSRIAFNPSRELRHREAHARVSRGESLLACRRTLRAERRPHTSDRRARPPERSTRLVGLRCTRGVSHQSATRRTLICGRKTRPADTRGTTTRDLSQ